MNTKSDRIMVSLLPISLVLFLLLQSVDCSAVPPDTLLLPLPAHAHNDYEHERPLHDAVEHGFRSIEADVFSMGDSLYVAHDRKDIRQGRTLRELYLEPLMTYFSGDQGVIYDQDHPLILLVDIKDRGLPSYRLLDLILKDFRQILCHVDRHVYMGGRVMVIVSGDRPIEFMAGQATRFAFVDGRIPDLSQDYSPQLMPLISDRWGKYFSWKGRGEMPEKEGTQLRTYVQAAHDQGRMIRFWATPDSPGQERKALWDELLEAGADLINTDDLAGLRSFLIGEMD
jgi:hypothetical protein